MGRRRFTRQQKRQSLAKKVLQMQQDFKVTKDALEIANRAMNRLNGNCQLVAGALDYYIWKYESDPNGGAPAIRLVINNDKDEGLDTTAVCGYHHMLLHGIRVANDN